MKTVTRTLKIGTTPRIWLTCLGVLPVCIAGCGTGSGGNASSAERERLLEASERLAETSQTLVQSDAQARRELVEMQSQLQQGITAERRLIDAGQAQLDDERREIAAWRHRDPLIAAAIIQGTTLLVAALPILLLVLLFRMQLRAENDVIPTDVIIAEVANMHRERLESSTAARLPAPETDSSPAISQNPRLT